MIQIGKEKYLTRLNWIGMGGWVRDECNVCVSNVNIGFN